MRRFEIECAFCRKPEIPHNLTAVLDAKGQVVYACPECVEK